MFKKYQLILLFLLSCSCNCYGSAWDDFVAYLSNPCNIPGSGNIIENWHGKTFDRGAENALCPPWNKVDGRYNNTCLVQEGFDLPRPFIGAYVRYCAESTPESSYFNPKIRVRNQTCNSIACWTKSKTLNWDGECALWPSPVGLPLLRICARIALPANPIIGTPADPGYTLGTHLGFDGYQENDEPYVGVDGQPVYFDQPKLCAYKDPSLIDTLSLINPIGLASTALSSAVTGTNQFVIDIMDYNPKRQILHMTTDLHPLAKILIAIIDVAGSSGKSLGDMLATLLDSINSAIFSSGFNLFKEIFDFLGKVIDYVKEAFTALIKEFGQFNRVVDNYHFGCVEIPMGPFPPPFCPKILPFKPDPTTQPICKLDAEGKVIDSSSDDKCVISPLVNNLINNSIRVTFDNFVPLCRNGENPMLTDKCVTLSNVSSSAENLHYLTLRKDTIKSCSVASGSEPCVNTKIPFHSGFRIVYASKTGSTSIPSGYFFTDIENCRIDIDNNCQEIWGINIGKFIDTSLTFPAIQLATNISGLSKDFTLDDTSGAARSFTASIVRMSTYLPALSFQQEPSQVCVFEGNNVVGCENRGILTTMPLVYSCDSNIVSGLSCTSTYFAPKIITSLKIDNNSTSAVIEPLAVHNSNTINYQVNLAGFDFSSFVTDDNFVMKPFSGTNSPSPTSIYGVYKNGALPIDSSGKATNAVYLYGLEYVSDKYLQGGKRVCLNFEALEACTPDNVSNCILSKLLSTNIANCQDFQQKMQTYPNLRLCQATDTNCVNKDAISGQNGAITIQACQQGYCYTSTSGSEVCKVSISPIDRFDPASSSLIGIPLALTEYYDLKNKPYYDRNTYGIRNKNSGELGLCVPILQPKCSAITTLSAANGNATWPETEIGQLATGTCPTGWSLKDPTKPLKRYCLAYETTQTIAFEALDPLILCRVSTAFVSETNTFLGHYIPARSYDMGASGGIEFGSTIVNVLTAGEYSSTVTYNIADLSNLNSFMLTSIAYDDYVLVTVNGGRVYSGPIDFYSLYYFNGKAVVDRMISGDVATWSSANNIDLKPYLQTGINTIQIKLVVVGGGGLYYKIDYTMKN